MTRGETANSSAIGSASGFCTEADLARYAAAAVRAAHPGTLMTAAEEAFRDMTVLVLLQGDRVAARCRGARGLPSQGPYALGRRHRRGQLIL